MIDKATEMEDGPSKTAYINLIGSFMKSACRNWNDEMLEDEQILTHLEMLSGGKIKLVEKDGLEFKHFETKGGGLPNNNPTNTGRKKFKHRNQQGGQNRHGQGGGKGNFRPFKKNNPNRGS
jgi:hypothetical protein